MARKSNTKAAPNNAAENVAFVETNTAKPTEFVGEQPVHADTDSMQFSLRGFMEMMGVTLPTWKRVLCSFVAALATGWMVGAMANVIINILVLGTMAVTNSMFLVWVVLIAGVIAGLYCAWVAGRAVTRYILSGDIDDDCAKAKAKVSGWFKRKDKAIVAAPVNAVPA
jgi:hypothetical protein